MTTEVILTGTGVPHPRPGGAGAAVLVRHRDVALQFDAGRSTVLRLMEAGTPPHALSAVFLTHVTTTPTRSSSEKWPLVRASRTSCSRTSSLRRRRPATPRASDQRAGITVLELVEFDGVFCTIRSRSPSIPPAGPGRALDDDLWPVVRERLGAAGTSLGRAPR